MDVLWTDRKDKVKDIVPHATYSHGASSTKNAGLDGTSYMCSTLKTKISNLMNEQRSKWWWGVGKSSKTSQELD